MRARYASSRYFGEALAVLVRAGVLAVVAGVSRLAYGAVERGADAVSLEVLAGVYIGGALVSYSALSREVRATVALYHALRWPIWLLLK